VDFPAGLGSSVTSRLRVSTHPAAKIDELLPSEWKKLNAQADTDLRADTAKIVRVA